jgi:hypothetical protein
MFSCKIVKEVPSNAKMYHIAKVVKNPNAVCHLPMIWRIAEQYKSSEHIQILPEYPHTSPGEKRYDVVNKKNMSFQGFKNEYGWCADSVWESSEIK